MSLYSLFDTNEEAEAKGFLFTIEDGDVSISFLLARAGGANKKFAAAMGEALRPHQHAMNAGNLDESVLEGVQTRVMAETLILDWSNVGDADGNEMECTPDNIFKLLTDLPELRREIWEEATKRANYAKKEREDTAKS